MSVIRVLVVDDHPVVRRGITDLLGSVPDVEVVGTAGDGDAGVTLAATLDPDVVLMDIEMPGVDGVEATQRIGATAPRRRGGDPHDVRRPRPHHPRARRRRGRLPAQGRRAVGAHRRDPRRRRRGRRRSHRASRALAARPADAIPASLTPREREVLALVADGLANKQIARRLGIAEKTVKAHLTRVFAALDVTDRTQAALWVACARDEA